MGARHSGREAALQMLFQMETSSHDAEQAIGLFFRSFEAEPEGRSYAEEIVRGVHAHLESIDESLRKASTHWRLERMARVDRNILRLGAWELTHKTDVPTAVVLDEAVELAKSFGSEESSAFVNGVLQRIASDRGGSDTGGA
jgi:N utilization substance protein B